MMLRPLVIIKGAGDLATGVAHRLACCGFSIVMLEIPKPTVIRRTVAFAEVIYTKDHTVEGITATLAQSLDEVTDILNQGKIAVLVDPQWISIKALKPIAIVDAILAKKNLGTNLKEAPIVIGLGPGFLVGKDVHAIIETKRGHQLGKVISFGSAIPDTGIPGDIGGYSKERIVRSPSEGIFKGKKEIGDIVVKGDLIATIGNSPIYASISGILRGLLHNDLYITKGFKVGDIDPRDVKDHCFTISDKARSVGGGVLEALLHFLNREGKLWT